MNRICSYEAAIGITGTVTVVSGVATFYQSFFSAEQAIKAEQLKDFIINKAGQCFQNGSFFSDGSDLCGKVKKIMVETLKLKLNCSFADVCESAGGYFQKEVYGSRVGVIVSLFTFVIGAGMTWRWYHMYNNGKSKET